MAGRPTKCTPEVMALVFEALEVGAAVPHACEYAGISVTSFGEWLRRAERGDGEPYSTFAAGVHRARASGAVAALKCVRLAVDAGDWKAAIAMLKATHPQFYGPTITQVADKRDVRELPDEELDAKIVELAKSVKGKAS